MKARVRFFWFGCRSMGLAIGPKRHPFGLRRIVAGITCLMSVLQVCGAAHADDGAKLAQRVYDRADGRDATSTLTMALTEEGKPARMRTMLLFRARGTGGQVATLIRFTDPADIQGTGLLTLDGSDGLSNQWIYLPAMQRVRRVDSNRKGGRFVNSDYYFEDLRDRKPSLDTHRLVGRERVGDTECDLLESIPADPSNSVYLRRVSCIEPKSLLPLRIEFFERKLAQPSKRLMVNKREQIQTYWTVMDSTLTDLATGHQTRLTVGRVLYDRSLPESLFTSRALEDERVEREFRP